MGHGRTSLAIYDLTSILDPVSSVFMDFSAICKAYIAIWKGSCFVKITHGLKLLSSTSDAEAKHAGHLKIFTSADEYILVKVFQIVSHWFPATFKPLWELQNVTWELCGKYRISHDCKTSRKRLYFCWRPLNYALVCQSKSIY